MSLSGAQLAVPQPFGCPLSRRPFKFRTDVDVSTVVPADISKVATEVNAVFGAHVVGDEPAREQASVGSDGSEEHVLILFRFRLSVNNLHTYRQKPDS